MANTDIVPAVDQLHVLKGIQAIDLRRRMEEQLKNPWGPCHLLYQRAFQSPRTKPSPTIDDAFLFRKNNRVIGHRP